MTYKQFLTLLVDVVAVYRLTRLVIQDEITEDLREAIWKKFPVETKIGYLITCEWCTSIWAGALIFGLRKTNPEFATWLSSTLAASAATGIAYSKLP